MDLRLANPRIDRHCKQLLDMLDRPKDALAKVQPSSSASMAMLLTVAMHTKIEGSNATSGSTVFHKSGISKAARPNLHERSGNVGDGYEGGDVDPGEENVLRFC